MRCLADFILDSDLCLKPETPSLVLKDPNGRFSLTLSNAVADHALSDAVLSAQLIFETQSLDKSTREFALDKLAELLNFLSYVTNRKFVFRFLKKIIDWTPGVIERRAFIYAEKPEWDTAEPMLNAEFIDSAERLLAIASGEEQQSAMRWYRLGAQERNLEQQFSYLWFALEIAAQYRKGREKVPSKCSKCQGDLFCERCGEHPLHRRYPGEAIKQLIETVHPKNSDEVFRTLQLIRHTLLHGGRIRSVQAQLPCTDQEALNKLALVTSLAINRMFDKPDPRAGQPMTLGYVDNFARRTIVGSVDVLTTLKPGGDPNNPKISDFPNFNFEITRVPPEPTGSAKDNRAE